MIINLNINDARAYLTQPVRDTLNVAEKGQSSIGCIANSKAVLLFHPDTPVAVLRESLRNIENELDTLSQTEEGRVDK